MGHAFDSYPSTVKNLSSCLDYVDEIYNRVAQPAVPFCEERFSENDKQLACVASIRALECKDRVKDYKDCRERFRKQLVEGLVKIGETGS